jgi:hypothetical protein
MEEFSFEYVSTPAFARRPTNPTPSMTESILHNIAISNAEQEAADFVRSINSLQAEMARSTASRQLEIQRQLQECHEAAKARFSHFEHLADIWRGAEFNLSQFLYRLDHGWREQVLRNAEWEEESRISMEQAAARQAQLVRALESLPAEVQEVLEQPQQPQEPQQPEQPTAPTTIQELIALVENEAQKQALGKLLLRNEANQIYLASYEANTVTRGRGSDVEGTFTVLGTIRNGTRDSYTVKWYRWTPVGHSFWCNCPDHKFNSARKNMVCKHICFLITKVGRILDPAFFQAHRFTEEQHATFRQAVGNAAIFADGARERERMASAVSVQVIHPGASREARRAQFMEMRRPVGAEDSCPICYDEMGDGTCLNCPTCSNNVHRDCMEVWLERNKTCVFCRSDVWRAW